MLHELGHATLRPRPRLLAPVAAARPATRRHRGHRDPDGAARRATPSGWSGSWASTRRRRPMRRVSARPGRRAARLHPLGARDDELRALALRRSRGGPRRRWWELVERFQLVAPPAGRRAPDWAAKIHIACAPVYYHTYLYGQIVASQLAATLERECGGLVDRPEAGGSSPSGCSPRAVGALGPADRAGDRRAADARRISAGTSPRLTGA